MVDFTWNCFDGVVDFTFNFIINQNHLENYHRLGCNNYHTFTTYKNAQIDQKNLHFIVNSFLQNSDRNRKFTQVMS